MSEQFLLRPEDIALLASARALGDWIMAQWNCTSADRSAVLSVQAILDRFPGPSFGVDASYCVTVMDPRIADWIDHKEASAPQSGFHRVWCVDYSTSHVVAPTIEIFSLVNDLPRRDAPDEDADEMHFHRQLGDHAWVDAHNFDRWAREIRDFDKIANGRVVLLKCDSATSSRVTSG